MTNPFGSQGSHDEEPLVTVPVSAGNGPDNTGSYRIRPPAGGPASSTRWIMPGETVDIDDLSIGRGFFYVGDFRRARPGPVDACVVDTGAPLAQEAADPGAGPFVELVERYYASRYGEEPVTRADLERLVDQVVRPERRAA